MKRFAVFAVVVVLCICLTGICCFATEPTDMPTVQPTVIPDSFIDPDLVNADNFVGSVWVLKKNWAETAHTGILHITFSILNKDNYSVRTFFNYQNDYSEAGKITLYYYQNSFSDRVAVSRFTQSSGTYDYYYYSEFYIRIDSVGIGTVSDNIQYIRDCYDLVYLPGNGMGTVIEGAKTTFANFLLIGSDLVSFVVSNWITLIALIAFVVVFGIGVVIRIVKKRG